MATRTYFQPVSLLSTPTPPRGLRRGSNPIENNQIEFQNNDNILATLVSIFNAVDCADEF